MLLAKNASDLSLEVLNVADYFRAQKTFLFQHGLFRKLSVYSTAL